MKLTYIRWSMTIIETVAPGSGNRPVTIVTDPVFRMLGVRQAPPSFTFARMPRPDLVFVSHSHPDHYEPSTLKRLPPDTPVWMPAEMVDRAWKAVGAGRPDRRPPVAGSEPDPQWTAGLGAWQTGGASAPGEEVPGGVGRVSAPGEEVPGDVGRLPTPGEGMPGEVGRVSIPGNEGRLPPPGLGPTRQHTPPRLIGVRAWESALFRGIRLTVVPALHGGDELGLVVEGDRTVYFAGDTSLDADLFREISRRWALDAVLLPIGGLRVLGLPIGHIGPKAAAQALSLLGEPRVVVPTHYSGMSLFPLMAFPGTPRKLSGAIRQANLGTLVGTSRPLESMEL